MKIAIGIAGHYKNFDLTKESILFLKNTYNADVFVHSYTTKSFPGDSFVSDKDRQITDKDFKILSPKKLILELGPAIHKKYSKKIALFKSVFKLTPVKEIDSQVLSIRKRRKVLELIDDSYDFIILIRPDTLILEFIKLDLEKINLINLLDLYQDSFIAGPSKDIKNLIFTIDKNFGIALDKGKFISCPHKVLKYYSNSYNVNLLNNAKITLIPKDSDTIEKRIKQFNKLFV